MRTTKQFTSDLADALAYHVREQQSIENDPSLADLRPEIATAQRNRRLGQLNDYTAGRVARAARSIWGSEENPSLPLQGGAFWHETEEADGALREARDKAGSGVDYHRLQVAISRVPERLRPLLNVQEAKRLYQGSDTYERMALETGGAEHLRRQFPNETAVGGFVAELATNRERRFRTDEVVEAEKRVADVNQAGVAAYKLTRRAADTLGLSGPFQAKGVGSIIGSIIANYSVDAPTGRESWAFSKRGPRVMVKGSVEPQGVG